jgi:predicted amidohydrolase
MKAGVYQFAPCFGDIQANVRRIREQVEILDADLVVLPELCTTGYQFLSEEEVLSLSEPVPEGPSVRAFLEMSRRTNTVIVAGMAEREGDAVYNTAVVTGPDGFIGKYRKVHLFREEKRWFRPGGEFPVFTWQDIRIGVMICFDWLFPEAARSLALQGADILCHPANLVLPYCQRAMITRSLENRVFALTANRVGREERKAGWPLLFTGESQIVAPDGEILFRMGREQEGGLAADLDIPAARDKHITPLNAIWEDRSPDAYLLANPPADSGEGGDA